MPTWTPGRRRRMSSSAGGMASMTEPPTLRRFVVCIAGLSQLYPHITCRETVWITAFHQLYAGALLSGARRIERVAQRAPAIFRARKQILGELPIGQHLVVDGAFLAHIEREARH